MDIYPRHQLALAEAPSLYPEPVAGPELRLIEGGGEAVDAGTIQRPDLHVVPDPTDHDPAGQEATVLDAEAALTASPEGASVANTGKLAVKASRLVKITEYDRGQDRYERKVGGGNWMIKLHQEQLKAEAKARAQFHNDDCNCPDCKHG